MQCWELNKKSQYVKTKKWESPSVATIVNSEPFPIPYDTLRQFQEQIDLRMLRFQTNSVLYLQILCDSEMLYET